MSRGCEVKRETLNLVVSPVIVVNSGGPNLLWWMQATMATALVTSDGHPLRGRRQHRATQSERERARLVIKFLAGSEHRRVCRTNCKKEGGKGQ
jgi:hypothetical protein